MVKARRTARGVRVSSKPCKNCGHGKSYHIKKKFNCKLCTCRLFLRK